MANPFNITNTDWHNSIWTVLYNYWSDDGMSTEDAVAALKDEFDVIFG